MRAVFMSDQLSKFSFRSWMRRPGFMPLYSLVVSPGQTQMEVLASCSNSWAIPLRIPCPKPSRITRMNIPDATDSPVRKVRSLFLRMVSKISCHLSRSNMWLVF